MHVYGPSERREFALEWTMTMTPMAVAAGVLFASFLHGQTVYEYKTTPQGPLKIVIYLPKDGKPADKRAAMLFLAGSGARDGSYYAARGMVGASLEHRGGKPEANPHLGALRTLQDSRSGIRWLRTNAGRFGVDPDRIAVGGGSASADIAILTALAGGYDAEDDSPGVSATPNVLVLYNPGAGRFRPPNPAAPPPDPLGAAFAKLRTSPFDNLLRKGNPPAILLYGTEDPLLAGGREFVGKSIELGNRAELYTAEGQHHAFFQDSPWREAALYKIDEFLASLGYLQGKPAVKIPAGAKAAMKQELPAIRFGAATKTTN
jgi:acetyl esterase/lipase